jgi:hypothetical protein
MKEIAICERKRVNVSTLGPYVWLELLNEVGLRPAAFGRLTPRQARRLAAALVAEADELDPPSQVSAVSAEGVTP